MSTSRPFTINIPQAKLDVLRQKLLLAEFPDELEEAGWDLGCPLEEIKRLTSAWVKWDWRQAEKRLNQYPQFHADIDVDGFGTLDVHFVHQKSKVGEAIPLLFVHGCECGHLCSVFDNISFFIACRVVPIHSRRYQLHRKRRTAF